jgi:hypothetical protein
MDLIDLIILIIKQFSKPSASQQRVAPPSAQDIARQKAEVERRIREMQAALSQHKGKAATAPLPQRRAKPTVKAQPESAPVAHISAPLSTSQVAETVVPERRATVLAPLPRQGIVIPFLLGEVLAPPLALRETEF